MMFGLSFYGVMVILTRFFLEDLNYSEADTMMVVGAFSSIGPLFAIAGGFIADKFLGAYRSLAISYVMVIPLTIRSTTSAHFWGSTCFQC